MLRKKPEFAMNADQLLGSVIDRIATAYPTKNMEEVVRTAERAVRVLNHIRDLPKYSQIINMNHMELVLTLQQCPESPYFARDDFNTTEAEARKLVLAFVERRSFSGHEPHLEANPSSEYSSQQSNHSGNIASFDHEQNEYAKKR